MTRQDFEERGKNSKYLKTQSSLNRRSLNDFSEPISVLAQSSSVLVMNEWMNKLIA